MREYGVDGRQLLAVKSLYSCSDICDRVGKLNHGRSLLVLDYDKGVCCHRSSSWSIPVFPNLFVEGIQIQTCDFVGEHHYNF